LTTSLRAACDCGFSTELIVGGGTGAFAALAMFPAYCRSCRQLLPVNLAAGPLACSLCKGSDVTPYDDESLQGQAGLETVASCDFRRQIGRVLTLTDGTYLCPVCGKHGLRFHGGDVKWGSDEMRLG
jgi:hypothetical protein